MEAWRAAVLGALAPALESDGGLAFARPELLPALAIPLVLLALAKLFARPDRRATGSLALWLRLATRDGEAAKARRPGVPLPLWLLAGSLAAAILALAGPRIERAAPTRMWRLLLDRSPSMYLPLLPERSPEELRTALPRDPLEWPWCAQLDSGAALRIEVAFDAALAELSANWRPGDRLLYLSPNRESLQLDAPVAPPPEWWCPEQVEEPSPDFVAGDAPGALFVTDRAFPVDSAALFASGGEPVPGSIGRRQQQRIVWQGGDVLSEEQAPTRTVLCEGEGVVAEFLESWCRARGFAFTREARPSEDVALELCIHGADEASAVRPVGRDGWTLGVRPSRSLDGDDSGAALGEVRLLGEVWPRSEVWLRSDEQALVTSSPGRVDLFWSSSVEGEPSNPGGDPAAFALSFAKLFDRAVLPEWGAVSLEERQSAGEAQVVAGEPPLDSEPAEKPERLEAPLAWLAAALAAGAAWTMIGRGAGESPRVN